MKKIILVASFAIIAAAGSLYAYNKSNSNSKCSKSCCGAETCQTACTCDDNCKGEDCTCGCACCK